MLSCRPPEKRPGSAAAASWASAGADGHPPKRGPQSRELPAELWGLVAAHLQRGEDVIALAGTARGPRAGIVGERRPQLAAIFQRALDRVGAQRGGEGVADKLAGLGGAGLLAHVALGLDRLRIRGVVGEPTAAGALGAALGATCGSLTRLDLCRSPAVCRHLEGLGRLASLRHLVLAQVDLGADALAHIGTLMALVGLDLSGNRGLGPHLDVLSPLGALRDLSLADTALEPTHLGALSALNALVALDVGGNAALAASRAWHWAGLTGLVHLGLAGCCGDAALLEGLGVLSQLTALDIGGNAIGVNGALYLEGHKQLEVLRASEAKLSLGVIDITRLGRLREVDLSGVQAPAVQWQRLDRLTRLTRLRLSRVAVSTSACAALGRLDSLVALGLADNRLSVKHILPIAALTRLEELDLGGTGLRRDGLARLAPLRRLRRLGLAGLAVGPRAVAELLAWPALADLDVSRTSFADTGLAALVPLSQLRRLDVRSLGLTGRAVPQLARMAHLVEIRVGDNPHLLAAMGGQPWCHTGALVDPAPSARPWADTALVAV